MSVTKWIKQEKLKEMSVPELQDRAAELKATIFTNRFHLGTGKLENYRLIPQAKRRLAAVLSLIHERETSAKEAGK